MSSINNSYGNYSYDYKKVHNAVDKDKNGYLTQNEIKAFKQKLANKNTTSAKKATHFLTGLLNNYSLVKSLTTGHLAPQGIPHNSAQLEWEKENVEKETTLGISMGDFGRLAYVNATYGTNTIYLPDEPLTINNFAFDNLQSKVDLYNSKKSKELPPP